MASNEGSGEGRVMSDDRVTQTVDQGDAITTRNQLSSHLSTSASGELRKRIRGSSPQAMLQHQHKKAMTQSSVSPHLLQRAFGETSTGHSMPTFPSSPNSSLYTSAPLRSSGASGFNMNAVGSPLAASSRAPSMTRMFERPSGFMSPTHISNMSRASPYSDMIPAALPNTSSSPVVAPKNPMLTSLTNMRPHTFMGPTVSAAPAASSGTRHAGVARNMPPAAFANSSFSLAHPEGSIVTSMANPATRLMPRPIPTAPTSSTRTVPHHTGVGRSSFPAAFASNSFSMASPEGSILVPVANLGHPLMPQRMPTTSTASAWTVPHQTGTVRSTFPAAFARNTYPAVSPVVPLLSSLAISRPPTPMAPPISYPPTASAMTAPCHTGLARSPVPALRTVMPGALTSSANTPASTHAPRRFPEPEATPAEIEAWRKALLFGTSLGKPSPPHTASQGSAMTPRIKWQGFDTPKAVGFNCMICKRDLSYAPEGPISIPSIRATVAVLPCGHTFHDHCLQLITPEEQRNSPPCIPCAIGEN